VRCRRCGNVLWRRYPDHVEMSLTPRGGQKRVIRAPVDAVLGLGVTCEKCQSVTVASPSPLPAPTARGQHCHDPAMDGHRFIARSAEADGNSTVSTPKKAFLKYFASMGCRVSVSPVPPWWNTHTCARDMGSGW
jgi:hypothetical protein